MDNSCAPEQKRDIFFFFFFFFFLLGMKKVFLLFFFFFPCLKGALKRDPIASRRMAMQKMEFLIKSQYVNLLFCLTHPCVPLQGSKLPFFRK